MTSAATGVQRFEIVGESAGRGLSVAPGSGALRCVVAVSVAPKTRLRSAVLTAELSGVCATRVGGATFDRVFHCDKVVVVDDPGKWAKPENGLFLFPVVFALPKADLPPSFASSTGSIDYRVSASLSCQESKKLFRSNYETDAPVVVHVSNQVRAKLVDDSAKMISTLAAATTKLTLSDTETIHPSTSSAFFKSPSSASDTPESASRDSFQNLYSPPLTYDSSQIPSSQPTSSITADQKTQLLELIKLQKAQADLSNALADVHLGGRSSAGSSGMNSLARPSITGVSNTSSLMSPISPGYGSNPTTIRLELMHGHSLATLSSSGSSMSDNSSSFLPEIDEQDDLLQEIMSTYSSPVSKWSVTMVADWVQQFDVSPASVAAFIEQEIDGVALLTLGGDDLKNDLKVTALGTRRRISVALEKLQRGQGL
ncbi:hypothetical protein HDU98_011341 [Podochytrium sp. JEL0797]|nr:hypothetical protein HDU98_011341 [Podochytrium sp. JEL0797]